ncbi:MAG: hypothetical protein HC822_21435 [Oscillochloris sp.]|nr:hypothetical protein [Oscillochloris sp.]
MPLTPPNLDDRDFASLFKEARSRIPRYVPEWTDWNDSDPGITLVQLQTWLADTILYRLNQVPDANYIKFLQLIGVEQLPAQPAWTELTFTLKEKNVPTDVLIPAGQIVGVSARDLEQPVFFETDRSFRAMSARLELVIRVLPGSPPLDITQDNNAAGRSYAPFGDPAQTGGMLVLGFRSPLPAPLPFSRDEIGLQIYQPDEGQALLARQQEAVCGPPIPAAGPPPLAWEWWDGVDWSDLDVSGDATADLSQSGQIFFRVPGQIPAVPFASSISAHSAISITTRR